MTRSIFEPPERAPAEPCGCNSCSARPDLPAHLHLFSGEFFDSVEDLRIPGRGLAFAWVRKYRSRTGPYTAQGNRWDFSYHIRIEIAVDKLTLYNGDGRADLFHPQPNGDYARDEFFCVGHRNRDGDFTFTFPDNGTWNFLALDGRPEQGKISTIIDRNANRLTFHYDRMGRVAEIVDPLDRHIRIAYDVNSFIESITDFIGRRVVYAYYRDSEAGGLFGDLKSVTGPAVVGTPNANDFPRGKTTVYTYSKDSTKDLSHNLLTITDASGQTYLRNTYSAASNPGSLDFARIQRQTLGGDGDTIDVDYAPQTPTAENNFATLVAIVRDRNSNVKEYLFDSQNRCVLMKEYTGRARPNAPVRIGVNRPTGPLRDADPPFFETRFQWNADALLTRVTHPNGNATEKDYEGDLSASADRRMRGNLRAIRNVPGPLSAGQSPLVQLFDYHPDFGCSCGSNFVATATDQRGNATLCQFDSRGNLLRIQHRLPSIVEEFEYNVFGQLIRHIHPDNGNAHRQVDVNAYYTEADGSSNGYLKDQIIDASSLGLTTTYAYDSVGNVTRLTDPRGYDSQYIWNHLNQLVREFSSPINDRGDRYQVSYFYDANDNRIRTETENRNDQGALQPVAHFTITRDYDILNYCVRMSKEVGQNHRVVAQFSYDGNRNKTFVRYGEATNGNQPANAVRMAYDERDLLFQKVRAPGDTLQSTTQYDYDPGRNRVRIRMGLESSPRDYRYDYDGYGRLIRITDPLTSTFDYRYDLNGNVLSQQMIGVVGNLTLSPKRLRQFQVNNRFDEMDRLVSVETACFDVTTQAPIGTGKSLLRTEYSANSEIVRTIDDNDHEVRTTYDTANRKRTIIDHKGNTASYTYDRGSNVIQVAEVDKSDTARPDRRIVTSLAYDNVGRLIEVADNLGDVNRFLYDSRSNRTLVIDALGNTTRLEYDGLDRLVAVTRVLTDNGTGHGTPVGSIVTAQTWDDSSRLTSRVDPNGNVTKYSYDPLNREISVLYADRSVHTRTFDVHGNAIRSIDPNGTEVRTSYDLLNRPVQRSIVPGVDVSRNVSFERYEYDPLSRLVHAQNDHSIVNRTYDSLSRVIREELNGRFVASAYDGVGNKLRCTYPSGREIVVVYDELNRKQSIVDKRSTLARYHYIGPARLEARELGAQQSQSTITYTYDDARRLIALKHGAGAAGSVIDDQEYAWDSMHNKTRQSDLRGGAAVRNRHYEYDSAYRLRASSISNGAGQPPRNIDYRLDHAGNRVGVTGGELAGPYIMSANKPVPDDRAVNQYTSTPSDSRRNDKNGNLILLSDLTGKTLDMTYDHQNRLVECKDSASGVSTSYAYDALGRRVARTVQGTQTQAVEYFYDDLQIIEERNRGTDTVTTYVYGIYFNDIVSMNRGTSRFFYHADDLGSVIAITDDNGKLAERYEYQDFGEPMIRDAQGQRLRASSAGNPYLFTGQRYEPETGLYDYGTRYLEPKTGRFTSRDTIGMWGDGGNLGNGYTYAHNNPQTYVDPHGRSVYRLISCGGPWPGPRTFVVEYEGCDLSRRQGLDNPVCRAFRAAGRAFMDVQNLWLNDLVGFSMPSLTGTGVETTRQRIRKWFGGMDNGTSTSEKLLISGDLGSVFSAIVSFDFDIDCEGGCDAGVNAYVNWGGYDVNLCDRFFNAGFTNGQKAAMLIHELTHAYADTDDHFYYPVWGSNSPWNQLLETTPWLDNNADTYMQFVMEFYT